MRNLIAHGNDLMKTLDILRTKALRKGIWFTTMSTEERVLAGLIKRYVKIVRNTTLATVLARMIVKLIQALRDAFWKMIETIGRPMAERAAKGACMIGWDASKWAIDPNIVTWYGLATYSLSVQKRWRGIEYGY